MNAILDVNQGAALVLASEAAARRLALAPARWVYRGRASTSPSTGSSGPRGLP